MEQVDETLARWAVGTGAAVVDRAVAMLEEGLDTLAAGTRLRRDVTGARAAFALTAAVARRRAIEDGVPGAASLVLTSESLAQASHPAVAAWRAGAVLAVRDQRASDPTVVDLCAGTGGDATAIATAGAHVVAVERDPGRAVLLAHRAAVLGVDVDVVVGDALAPPVELEGRVVHADPDRRDATGRRARRLGHHGPPVGALLDVLDAGGAAAGVVTVAPGVSWQDDDLPADAGLTFVEVAGRLVEALLTTTTTVRARAVRLPEAVTLERGVDVTTLPVGPVGSHLLVPSPALTRARLHDVVGAGCGARRLAATRALLTADAVPPPEAHGGWVTVEQVEGVVGVRPAALRDWLRGDDDASSSARAAAREHGIEVLTHGLDVEPARFVREAGGRTGPHGVRLHLVRRDHDSIGILARRTP